jgi:hypothetical protein
MAVGRQVTKDRHLDTTGVAGVAWLVLAPVFKTGGARREALLGGFDSHRLPFVRIPLR